MQGDKLSTMVIRRISEIAKGDDTRTKGRTIDDDEDCLGCRLVGGGGLTALGIFIMYQAREYVKECQKTNIQPKKPRIVIGSIAALSFVTLGAMRFSGTRLPWTEENDD